MSERRVRTLIVALGIAAVAGLLLFSGPFNMALAQSTPWGGMMGSGAWHGQMMGQSGGDMGSMHTAMSGMGQMPAIHEQVTAALAARLDTTPEELQAQLAQGTTLAQLAEAKGIQPEALRGVMVSAMQQAIKDLVDTGALDARQAAALRAHVAQMPGTCLTVDMSHMSGMMGTWGAR